jgi:hypothetical protein
MLAKSSVFYYFTCLHKKIGDGFGTFDEPKQMQ